MRALYERKCNFLLVILDFKRSHIQMFQGGGYIFFLFHKELVETIL